MKCNSGQFLSAQEENIKLKQTHKQTLVHGESSDMKNDLMVHNAEPSVYPGGKQVKMTV